MDKELKKRLMFTLSNCIITRGDSFERSIAEKQFAEAITALEAAEGRIAELEKRINELKSVIAWANNSLYGSRGFFLSLNGGADNEHHLDNGIEKLKANCRRLDAALAQAIATANLDREAGFHSEYCPHGAEWGQCTLCPARAGDD